MRAESMILVQTGIRDTDILSSVESSLLEPLRSILAKSIRRITNPKHSRAGACSSWCSITTGRAVKRQTGKRLSKRLRAASLREWGEVWQSVIHKMAEDSRITTKKNSKLGKVVLSFVDTIEGFYDPSILALIKQVASSSPSPTDIEVAYGLLGASTSTGLTLP